MLIKVSEEVSYGSLLVGVSSKYVRSLTIFKFIYSISGGSLYLFTNSTSGNFFK